MAVDPEFVAAVASSNVCALYYALCDEYPLRLRIPRTTLAKTAVLEAAAARELPLEKLRGPGAVYRLSSLPENLSLNVIIQGGGSLETDFTVHFRDRPQRDVSVAGRPRTMQLVLPASQAVGPSSRA